MSELFFSFYLDGFFVYYNKLPSSGSPVWRELVRKQTRLEEMMDADFVDQLRIPMVLSMLSTRHYYEFHYYVKTFKN